MQIDNFFINFFFQSVYKRNTRLSCSKVQCFPRHEVFSESLQRNDITNITENQVFLVMLIKNNKLQKFKRVSTFWLTFFNVKNIFSGRLKQVFRRLLLTDDSNFEP